MGCFLIIVLFTQFYESSNSYASQPNLDMDTFFFSHSNGWVVASHRGFRLHLPKMTTESNIFQVLNCYAYMFFSELYVLIFCPFMYKAVFLIIGFWSLFKHVLDTKSFIRFLICKYLLSVFEFFLYFIFYLFVNF